MKLSKRLFEISKLIDKNRRVIDVGCDHAYLDIYLTINNLNTCIAIDINENAIKSAKENIKKYKLDNKIDVKINDGLKNIKINKNDIIVISGMGTYTILDILSINKLSETLIISSNNNIEILRKEIVKKGYYINDERFIIDNNKGYVIIKFKKGYKKYKKIDYTLGPILKSNKEYKKYLINKYNKIIKNISYFKVFLKLKYQFLKLKIIISR